MQHLQARKITSSLLRKSHERSEHPSTTRHDLRRLACDVMGRKLKYGDHCCVHPTNLGDSPQEEIRCSREIGSLASDSRETKRGEAKSGANGQRRRVYLKCDSTVVCQHGNRTSDNVVVESITKRHGRATESNCARENEKYDARE